MAENKDYVTIPGEKGNINISEDVVTVVAANAALETDGVASLGREAADLWSKKPGYKGIRLANTDEGLKIEANIVCKLGVSVHKVAEDVQENIRASLESITGVKVCEVNVHVLGVQLDK